MSSSTILILGGNSIEHKEWIKTLKTEFNEFSDNFILHRYKHWYCEEEMIDFYFELEQMRKYDDYKHLIIIAKSVGAILAIKAIQNNILNPEKCVFMGFPLDWAYKNYLNIDSWSAYFSTPTLIFQNTKDPYCSFPKLQEYIECQEMQNIEFFTFENSTHNYINYEKMREVVRDFLNK
ncbi:MAG: alpha/beta family hydrolase [Candidatus Nanoarchaeia archaeon]